MARRIWVAVQRCGARGNRPSWPAIRPGGHLRRKIACSVRPAARCQAGPRLRWRGAERSGAPFDLAERFLKVEGFLTGVLNDLPLVGVTSTTRARSRLGTTNAVTVDNPRWGEPRRRAA